MSTARAWDCKLYRKIRVVIFYWNIHFFLDSTCKYVRKLWSFSYRVPKFEPLLFRCIKLAYIYLKYVTVPSKNEPFFLKCYRFTINCMLCRVRTSASVAFIISPSITSLNYSSALISHAKCRILHIYQQNRNTEKDPTVDASNDKKVISSLLFHLLLS
jgi:hypothetical protein